LIEQTDIVDLTNHLSDFVETAALVSRLALVITVDTSVTHLAGALGRPTWILLSYTPDDRWMLDRDDSPWYTPAGRRILSLFGPFSGEYEQKCRSNH
jgi:ADP-heptose:LPS heptosyltransferase